MEVLDLFLIPDLANLVNEYAKDNTQYNKVVDEINLFNEYYEDECEKIEPLYNQFYNVVFFLIKF